MKIFKNDTFFFGFLFTLVTILFRNAFQIKFFQDDYFFIHISNAKNLEDVLRFFSPFRTYSYKPLATEVFYFILKLLHYNTFIGHVIVFLTYFIGLIFLYKCLKIVTKNSSLSKLAVFIYAVSFIHVFQLYWLATYQEVLSFTALSASFYYYLQKKLFPGIIWFIAALLSKETALLYIPFLFIFEFIKQKRIVIKENRLNIVIYTLIAVLFYFGISRFSLPYVTALDNYKIQPTNLKLFLNNAMWYFLWSLGLPNFMPDVTKSIFSAPLPAFTASWKDPTTRLYFYLLIPFISLFALTCISLLVKFRKTALKTIGVTVLLIILFYVFLGPILFFKHKWMVRLMLPHVFIAILIAWIIYQLGKAPGLWRYLSSLTFIFFLLATISGIKLHESSSTYLLELRVFNNVNKYFSQNANTIGKYKYIYFGDKGIGKDIQLWGSEKIINSLHDQDFIDYFLPYSHIKVLYGFKTNKIPQNSYIINSWEMLRY